MIDIRQGDCLEVMRGMADASVTAIVTDPPYALEFMGKSWDKVLPSDEVWREALRVLKPGGMALVFGGTRTFHRLTCSLEDAGFQIRDCLCWLYGSGFPKSLAIDKAIDRTRDEDLAPVRVVCRYLRAAMDAKGVKSRHLVEHFGGCHSRLIDHWAARDTDSQPNLPTCEQWLILKEVLGFGDEVDAEVWRLNGRKGTPGEDWSERPKVGSRILSDTTKVRAGFMGEVHSGEAVADRPKREVDTTTAATDRSAPWNGYGTALKPAWEPIVLAMKPLDGTFAANALEHGVAGINVDGCRISHVTVDGGNLALNPHLRTQIAGGCGGGNVFPKQEDRKMTTPHSGGRWPANVVHDGSDEVEAGMGDAARYYYCAKASKKDRNAGTENLITWENADLSSDLEVIEELARGTSAFGAPSTDDKSCSIDWSGKKLVDLSPTDLRSTIEMASATITALRISSSSRDSGTRDIIRGAISTIWVAGSSPAELAERTRKWSQDTTDEKTASRLRAASALFDALSAISAKGRRGNVHSTVKPTELMRWLVRMVKMPEGTVVFDPFAGSGSTGVACASEGVDFISTEREAEYVEIARRRIEDV